MPIPTQPIATPSAWRGPSLQSGTDWIHVLSAQERRELAAAAQALREQSQPLTAIDAASHALPIVGPTLRRIRQEIQNGRGFALIRGVPIEGLAREDVARLYWLMGRHLGDPVPQNGKGDLLCDIRDTGADPNAPTTRLYTTRAEQDFHTDGADIIGLICLHTARSGGVSRIVSSVEVFNEVLRRRPDLVPLLFEDWYFHLHGQQPPGMEPYVRMPICRYDGNHLASFFIGWWIRRAQALPGVPALTPAQQELLALYESIANDPGFYLDMDFAPGDIQWLKNSVILHKRTEYVDWEEQERKRHLLRLWLAARDFEDGSELLRAGMKTQA